MSQTRLDLTVVNADQLEELIVIAMKARRVPMITSAPGVGKSAIVSSVARKMKLKLLDVRLSMADQTDLQGLPFRVGDKAKFLPFSDQFPTEDCEVPEGYNGWLLFLDELSSANRQVQGAAYKLILDRMVGMQKLHPRVVIVGAGNRLSDMAVTNPLSTALQSRLIHLSLDTSLEIWAKNVAIPNNYDYRIVSFLHAYPNYLLDFDPNHEDTTFACPRTWEFVDSIIKVGGSSINKIAPLIAGSISSAVCAKFIAFCNSISEMTPIEDILKDPENAKIPAQNQYRWATVISVAQNLNKDNIGVICKYIDRFMLPMQIIFYRNMVTHHKDLINTPEFQKGVTALGNSM